MSYGKAIELKATIDSSYGPTSAALYKKLPQKGHCDEMTVRNLLEPFTVGSNQWIDFVKRIAWSEHGPSESKIYSYFGYVENSARQVVPSPVGCRCCTSGSSPICNECTTPLGRSSSELSKGYLFFNVNRCMLP